MNNTLPNLISCCLEEMCFEGCLFTLGQLSHLFEWKHQYEAISPRQLCYMVQSLVVTFPYHQFYFYWSLFLFLPTVFKVRKKNAHHLICMNIQNQRIKNFFVFKVQKLEPIIQSEVSQKEKHQYSISIHIYGI